MNSDFTIHLGGYSFIRLIHKPNLIHNVKPKPKEMPSVNRIGTVPILKTYVIALYK